MPDLAGFETEARRVAHALGTSLVLMDSASMRQLINTALSPGVPVSTDSVPDFNAVVLTGGPLVTDLLRDASTGHPVVGVAVPVERAARIAYVLALAAGGAVLLMAAGVLAARKVLRPVHALGRHAAALAASTPDTSAATLPPASVRELEVLRQGLARAEAAIEARSRALGS